MGLSFSRIWARLITKTPTRVLMVGLDAAGKTTVLYKLKLGEVVNTIPTVGFNVESVDYKSLSFNVWDIGGQDKIRALWRYYYENTDAIIFVVDSNDCERIAPNEGNEASAREELHKLLTEDQLREAHLLVLANKQDLPNAMSVSEMTEKLGLNAVRNRQWYIQACCAQSGDGLWEGLDWLADVITKKR